MFILTKSARRGHPRFISIRYGRASAVATKHGLSLHLERRKGAGDQRTLSDGTKIRSDVALEAIRSSRVQSCGGGLFGTEIGQTWRYIDGAD